MINVVKTMISEGKSNTAQRENHHFFSSGGQFV